MYRQFRRVAQIATLIEEILNGCEPPELIALKAALAANVIFATEAVRSFRARHVRVGETVTRSAAPSPEERLLTPDEAAVLAGPSFTAKKLYRLRGSMPEQAWIRKGGRLYFREGPYRRWLATR